MLSVSETGIKIAAYISSAKNSFDVSNTWYEHMKSKDIIMLHWCQSNMGAQHLLSLSLSLVCSVSWLGSFWLSNTHLKDKWAYSARMLENFHRTDMRRYQQSNIPSYYGCHPNPKFGSAVTLLKRWCNKIFPFRVHWVAWFFFPTS
jgi:hypothetical protein